MNEWFGNIEERCGAVLDDLRRTLNRIEPRFLTERLKARAVIFISIACSIIHKHNLTGTLEKAPSVSTGTPRRYSAMIAIGLRAFEATVTVVDRRTGKPVTRKVQPWRYGKFLEFGFFNKLVQRFIAGDPFMAPAFDRGVDQFVAWIQYDVQQVLDR